MGKKSRRRRWDEPTTFFRGYQFSPLRNAFRWRLSHPSIKKKRRRLPYAVVSKISWIPSDLPNFNKWQTGPTYLQTGVHKNTNNALQHLIFTVMCMINAESSHRSSFSPLVGRYFWIHGLALLLARLQLETIRPLLLGEKSLSRRFRAIPGTTSWSRGLTYALRRAFSSLPSCSIRRSNIIYDYEPTQRCQYSFTGSPPTDERQRATSAPSTFPAIYLATLLSSTMSGQLFHDRLSSPNPDITSVRVNNVTLIGLAMVLLLASIFPRYWSLLK